jgi:kynurenine formamidase
LSVTDTDDHRVEFDFELEFTNGGALQGQGFRLDIDGESISDEDLATAIVADLRLLMVAEVRILRKHVIRERHKRRAAPSGGRRGRDGRVRIDLSHTVEDASNTGTCVDAPFHRYRDGIDLAELPLDRLADLDAVTINLVGSTTRSIDRAALAPYELRGKAVLVHTGWDQHWGSDQYFEQHPFLTADAARHLVDEGAALVGIDSLNVDDTDDPRRPVHSGLLAEGIPICEHLTNLGALPTDGYRFSALPVKVRALGTFPVRATAVLT